MPIIFHLRLWENRNILPYFNVNPFLIDPPKIFKLTSRGPSHQWSVFTRFNFIFPSVKDIVQCNIQYSNDQTESMSNAVTIIHVEFGNDMNMRGHGALPVSDCRVSQSLILVVIAYKSLFILSSFDVKINDDDKTSQIFNFKALRFLAFEVKQVSAEVLHNCDVQDCSVYFCGLFDLDIVDIRATYLWTRIGIESLR